MPTPRYLSKRKKTIIPENINPRRVLTRTIEKVNIKDKNIKTKKRGSTPGDFGSVKYIKEAESSQINTVTKRVGKKFFRNLISFFLISFFIEFNSKLIGC